MKIPIIRIANVAGSSYAQILLLTGLAIWFCLDVGPRADVASAEQHRTDLSVYTAAGAAILRGDNPYDVSNPRGWHYLYPPMFAIAIAPLSLLTPWWQACLWFALSVALCCGCYFECRKLLRRLRPARTDASVTAACRDEQTAQHRALLGMFLWLFACLPVLNTLQRGQVGLAVLYPLLLGFRLLLGRPTRRVTSSARRHKQPQRKKSRRAELRRFGLVGFLFSIPVVIKLTPALPVGFAILQTIRRAAHERTIRTRNQAVALIGGTSVGLVAFVIVIPSAVSGWQANMQNLQIWHQRVVGQQDVGGKNAFNAQSPRNQSLTNASLLAASALIGCEPDDERGRQLQADLRPVLLTVRLLFIAALLLAGLSEPALSSERHRAVLFGLSCGLTLIVSPLSWGHHFTLLVPAILVAGCHAADLRRLWLMAASPAVLCIVHYCDVSRFGCAGLLGLGITAWFVGVPWLLARAAGISRVTNRHVRTALLGKSGSRVSAG